MKMPTEPIPKIPTVWQNEMTQVYQLCYNCMLFNNSDKHPMCLIGGCEAAVINEQLIDALIDELHHTGPEYDRTGDDAEALKENEDE